MSSGRLAALAVISALVACGASPDDDESSPPAIEPTLRPNAEYLSPGVYVSEVPFRSTPIPGVTATSPSPYLVVADGGGH